MADEGVDMGCSSLSGELLASGGGGRIVAALCGTWCAAVDGRVTGAVAGGTRVAEAAGQAMARPAAVEVVTNFPACCGDRAPSKGCL